MMSRIQLIVPTEAYTEQILAYKRVFQAKNLHLHGCMSLDCFADNELSDWFAYLSAPAGTNRFGYRLVENATFLALDTAKQKIVGIINIRYELTEFLQKVGGHVGYSTHPDFWNQGYATEMLSLALNKCDQLGMNKVLITCDKLNPASAKVIIKNGGEFDYELLYNDKMIQRYWITRNGVNN